MLDVYEQTARTYGERMRDVAAAGVSSVERASDDPLSIAIGGVMSYYGGVGDMTVGYIQGWWDRGHAALKLGGELWRNPMGTASKVAQSTWDGFVENGVSIIDGEAETIDAVADLDPGGAAAGQWKVAVNSYSAASKAYVGAQGVKWAANMGKAGLNFAKGGGGNYVYRGLSSSDDIASGLSARAPGAGNSPISHVAGKRASEWISTTKDSATAIQKYGKNGVVRIDIGKVGSRVEDVSGGFPNGGRMSNWARADQEVLIQNHVPAEAITPFNFSLIP